MIRKIIKPEKYKEEEEEEQEEAEGASPECER